MRISVTLSLKMQTLVNDDLQEREELGERLDSVETQIKVVPGIMVYHGTPEIALNHFFIPENYSYLKKFRGIVELAVKSRLTVVSELYALNFDL